MDLDNHIHNLLNRASHAVLSGDTNLEESIKLDLAKQIYEIDEAIKNNVRPEDLHPLYKGCDLRDVLTKLQHVEQSFSVVHDLLYHLEQHELSWRMSVGLD